MKKILVVVTSLLLFLGLGYAKEFAFDRGHSNAGFSVKHLMITNVKGEFKDFNIKLNFDEKTKTINSFEGVALVSSIDTGIEKRDNHLKSDDFFDEANHPEVKFVMTSYKANGDEGEMTGNLTIRGTTKEVTFDVEEIATVIDFQGNVRVGFSVVGKINRMDYGLKWNKVLEAGGIAVGETVKITVDVQAIHKK
jgi:polyisoprenoid-binding protein YceI